MIDLPEVKLKALPNFPASVVGRTGISYARTNGIHYLDLNYSGITQLQNIPAPDIPTSFSLVWNSAKESYTLVPFALSATAGVSSIGGTSGALTLGNGLRITGSSLEVDIFVDSIAALRLLTPLSGRVVCVTGYYAPGDGGGGVFTSGVSGGYTENGGTVIGSGASAWLRVIDGPARALQWGLKGDATASGAGTDDTIRAQAFVDNNKGGRCIFDAGRKFKIGGLLLVGSTYNNTAIDFHGEFVLKARANLLDTNFQSLIYVGIAVQSADSVRIDGNFHGNRANQFSVEQTAVICLAGATNFSSSFLDVREISADGVYITTTLVTTNSANTDKATFGTLICRNSSSGSGRNAVSLISGDNITFGHIKSNLIGGVIGGFLMPGGFDIEPDLSYQSVKNCAVGVMDIITIGGSAVTVYAQPGSPNTVQVTFGEVNVTNVCAADVADSFGSVTVSNNCLLNVQNCSNVVIRSFNGRFTNAYGVGLFVANCDNVQIDGTVSHVAIGANLCTEDHLTGSGITNSNIYVSVRDVARYGFKTGNITNSKIRGSVSGLTATLYAGRYGVVASGATAARTQSKVVYEVNVDYDANWTAAYRNDTTTNAGLYGVTFANTWLKNVDFGYSWASYAAMCDMAVRKFNCPGFTDSTLGVPTTGSHLLGQYIKNANPVVGQPKGWYCTVAGTPGTQVSEGVL